MDDEKKTCCCGCSQRKKERSPEEYKRLIHRLNRIEGQIRGIRGMVEKDAYCVDILVQVAATTSALNSFAKELLAQHIGTCVADDLRAAVCSGGCGHLGSRRFGGGRFAATAAGLFLVTHKNLLYP